MNNSTQYARALYELVTKNPSTGKTYLHNLRAILARRGHEQLLPRIFREYQKLELGKQRAEESKRITPEAEQTRILLELYKKMTKHSSNPSL